MGTPKFSLAILQSLYDNFDVVGVCTKEDKPVGRQQKLTSSCVKKLALSLLDSSLIFTPKSLKNEEICAKLASLKPDFIVVAAYGKILPKEILSLAPCINIHTSLLPKYRGASPIQAAILAGDKQSGVSIMLMDSGLDTGDILSQTSLEISHKTALELSSEMARIGALEVVKVINNFANIKPIKQDDLKASKCTLISKEDGKISFLDAKEIYLKSLAFTPWPGIYLDSGIKLISVCLKDEYLQNTAGSILEIGKDFIDIGCKKGILRINSLQSPGKKILDARSFCNGMRLKKGDLLE